MDSTFNFIYIFLLNNDPVFRIIGAEFKKRHPKTANSGERIIHDWTPTSASIATMINYLKENLNIDVDGEEIKQIIKGPVGNIFSYQRLVINGTTFCTDKFEGIKGRTTHKYILYNKAVIGKQEEVLHVAYIEAIYLVTSNTIMKAANTYTLLKVVNYMDAGKHPSELMHCKLATDNYSKFNALPIVNAEDVRPINVALWSACNQTVSASGTFLLVTANANDTLLYI